MNNRCSSTDIPSVHQIIYEPGGITSLCSTDCSILDAAAGIGLQLRSDCGGQGKCGQCGVIVTSSDTIPEPTENEKQLFTVSELHQGYRLACCLYPQNQLRITIPEKSINSGETNSKNNISNCIKPDPLVKRQLITIPNNQGTSRQCLDLIDLISVRQTPEGWNPEINFAALLHLGNAADSIRFTAVNHRRFGLTTIFQGDHQGSLGVAFDIGTTTLAAYLCDFHNGAILSSASTANPQRRYGEDVVSRIAYTIENKIGLQTMRTLVIDAMNQLIAQCLDQVDCKSESIDEACIVGNPTMQHLCLGINPASLGSYPYLPVCRQSLDIRSRDIDLCLRPEANVHVFPVVSGFIGGDTVAAILADETHMRKEITLLIDIGTNGELVLGNSEQLWATSCATGPALEGAHISCGMRAISGAIDKVKIDPQSYSPDIHVIGGTQAAPIGLCGSGIIDAVAEMVKTGLILKNGRLREGLPGIILDDNGIGRGFTLYESTPKSQARQVVLTLADIRQVQLAKAALSTGIQLLLKRSGYHCFNRIVLTGAFGARFDWKNAILIGMLPEIPATASVEIIENGAGQGAVKALLSGEYRTVKDHFANSITFLDLSSDPDFTETFTTATIFTQAQT